MADMPKNCANCNQDFWIEEGFYYGAMYVSYFLTATSMFFSMGLCLILTGDVPRWFVFCLAGIVLIFWAYIFRLSRSVWIRISLGFDKYIQ